MGREVNNPEKESTSFIDVLDGPKWEMVLDFASGLDFKMDLNLIYTGVPLAVCRPEQAKTTIRQRAATAASAAAFYFEKSR